MTICLVGSPTSRRCFTAARRAVKGKRRKPGAASFFANLEHEILAQMSDTPAKPAKQRSQLKSSKAGPEPAKTEGIAFDDLPPEKLAAFVRRLYSFAPTRSSDNGSVCCTAYVSLWHKASHLNPSCWGLLIEVKRTAMLRRGNAFF
jgi:hypothetical protein